MNSIKDKVFGQHEQDPVILQLEELARVQKEDPGPHVNLARGYLARIQTPPNWNQEDAKKAVKSFHNAIAIARKSASSQVVAIQEMETRTLSDIAAEYKAYFESQPDLKWVNAAIWLLEHAMADAAGQPDLTAEIRNELCLCWGEAAGWYETRLNEEESQKHACLDQFVTAVENALKYTDDPETRMILEAGLASDQIIVGVYYAKMAMKSPVFSTGGTLIKMNDREYKGYANLAIRILDQGRRRLHKYPKAEDYTNLMTGANELLAGAYSTLYDLTWAHSKVRQSIGILKRGVAAVPQNADLWHALGKAYENLYNEYGEESTNSMNSGIGLSNSLFGGVYGGGCAVALVRLPVNMRLKSIEKKSNECYFIEQGLINNPSDPTAIPDKNESSFDSGEWLDYAKTAFSKVSVFTCLPLIAFLNTISYYWAIRVYEPNTFLILPLQLLSLLLYFLLILSTKELRWKPLLVVAGANVVAETIGYAAGSGIGINPLQILLTFTNFLILEFAAKKIFTDYFERRDFKKIGIFAATATGLSIIMGLLNFTQFRVYGNISTLDIIVIPALKTAALAFLAGMLVPWIRVRIRNW